MSNIFSYGFDDTFHRETSRQVQVMAHRHSSLRMSDMEFDEQSLYIERDIIDSMPEGNELLRGWEHFVGDTGCTPEQIASVTDSTSQAIGVALHRMLTYEINRVIEPRETPYDALRLFGTDSSIPEGYTEWTAKREEGHGKWEYSKGNPNSVPTSGFDQYEEKYYMATAVHAIRMNIHEMKNAQVMQVNLRQKLEKYAQRGRLEFLNERAWSNNHPGLSDILSYAWVPRIFATNTFGTGALSEDAEVKEIVSASRFNRDKTQNTYGPIRAIFPRDLYDYLNETYRSDQLDTTLMESLRKTMSYITEIEVSDNLVGRGPNGESVVLFDRPGEINHKLPVALKRLPVQRQGMDIVMYMYMVHGGIHIEQPLDCAMFLVKVSN